MFRDLINNQWFWLGAAGLLIVIFGLLLASYRVRYKSSQATAQDHHEEGWRPTGRIDFVCPMDSNSDPGGSFLLQAEDGRIVNSIGGLEHHEIRWRKATLKEAKMVVKTYHTQLNLATTAGPMVSPSRSLATESELPHGDNDDSVGKVDAADHKVEG
jgi:hypothetical protein